MTGPAGETVVETRDVVIVGAGPTGLAAAVRLKKLGIDDLVVLERETEAGGIPRHCGHTGFGLREFGRLMTGPAFARRAARDAEAAGVELRLGTAVTALAAGGTLDVATPQGPARLRARRVLLATGVRETPRPPRLVSGTRPWGVMTTGALQQLVYLKGLRPFARAVIVGSELVSFSAILTLRAGGMRPVAMIEPGARITARRPGDLVARYILGVPVLTETRLHAIHGGNRVEGVVVEDRHGHHRIDCDGVIFTGRFLPESAIMSRDVLDFDPGTGGPAVDQTWRCSDPAYYACGNLVHPVETAGRCYREGLAAAQAIAADLAGPCAPDAARVTVELDGALRYLCPQVVTLPAASAPRWRFNARAAREASGRLALLADNSALWSRHVHALPERRLTVPADALRGLMPQRLRLVLE